MGSGISAIQAEDISEMEIKEIKKSIEKIKKGDIKEYEHLKEKYGSIYCVPGIYDEWKQYVTNKQKEVKK